MTNINRFKSLGYFEGRGEEEDIAGKVRGNSLVATLVLFMKSCSNLMVVVVLNN